MSKDRLRRVQGLTKNFERRDVNRDNIIMIGDILIFTEKNKPFPGSIKKTFKGSKALYVLQGDGLQEENMFVDLQKINLTDNGSYFQWNGIGTNEVSKIRLSGKECRSIQPEIEMKDGQTNYIFNKSLMFDIGISIDSPIESACIKEMPTSSHRKCFICNANVSFEVMKIHVGKHILNGMADGQQPCGYCGRGSCQNQLGDLTKKGEKLYTKVISRCPFYVSQSRRVVKASTRHPCTNYLNKCTVCKADVWYYNLPHHFQVMHPNNESPEIDANEIALMKKSKI